MPDSSSFLNGLPLVSYLVALRAPARFAQATASVQLKAVAAPAGTGGAYQ